MTTHAQTATWKPSERALSNFTLWRVFWRSLFLQAAWNPSGMQNLGFAYALYPALRALYPDPADLSAATARHLAFFNTHPYAAAAVLGGTLHHEVRVARGEEKPDSVVMFKQALMGPLAALGDGFFWLSLRPACGALAVLLAFAVGPWSAVALLVAWNAVAIALRAWFFVQGWRQGDAVIVKVGAARLRERGERLRTAAALFTGAAAGFAAFPTGAGGPAFSGGMFLGGAAKVGAGLGALGLAAATWALVRAGLSPYLVLYGLAAGAIASVLVF